MGTPPVTSSTPPPPSKVSTPPLNGPPATCSPATRAATLGGSSSLARSSSLPRNGLPAGSSKTQGASGLARAGSAGASSVSLGIKRELNADKPAEGTQTEVNGVSPRPCVSRIIRSVGSSSWGSRAQRGKREPAISDELVTRGPGLLHQAQWASKSSHQLERIDSLKWMLLGGLQEAEVQRDIAPGGPGRPHRRLHVGPAAFRPVH